MSRTPDDAEITTRAARERLPARHEPHWRSIEGGLALGYRKGARGGVWLARQWAGDTYRKATLGRADDQQKATLDRADEAGHRGTTAKVMDYRQAQAAALAWATRMNRIAAGLEPEPAGPAKPYTVAQAIADYLADYGARGGKSTVHTRQAADAHIVPALGAVAVSVLTRDRIKSWHRALATTPARVRAKKGTIGLRPAETDPDAPRRRRATANRVLTILKAALNHARAEGRVACPDDAWSAAKPFREADKARVRYLLDDEVTRLANACPPDFRALAVAALMTGCRYGELAAMKVTDLDPQAGTVTIGRSKGGRPRHVVLTDEGRAFFVRQTAGKSATALMFQRDVQVKQATRDKPAETVRAGWGKSHQFRMIREACKAASITPAASFHVLRHTYASRLAMRGAPMAVIAAQLGHADTRLTERHYAHLSPSYVADMVRQSFGALGIGHAPDGAAVERMRHAG